MGRPVGLEHEKEGEDHYLSVSEFGYFVSYLEIQLTIPYLSSELTSCAVPASAASFEQRGSTPSPTQLTTSVSNVSNHTTRPSIHL